MRIVEYEIKRYIVRVKEFKAKSLESINFILCIYFYSVKEVGYR